MQESLAWQGSATLFALWWRKPGAGDVVLSAEGTWLALILLPNAMSALTARAQGRVAVL